MKIRVVVVLKKKSFYEEGIKQLLDSQKQNNLLYYALF